MQKGYVTKVEGQEYTLEAHLIDTEILDNGCLKIRLVDPEGHAYECLVYAPGSWGRLRIVEE